MKEEYIAPVLEVIRFDREDVITASGLEVEFQGDDLDLDDYGVGFPGWRGPDSP